MNEPKRFNHALPLEVRLRQPGTHWPTTLRSPLVTAFANMEASFTQFAEAFARVAAVVRTKHLPVPSVNHEDTT